MSQPRGSTVIARPTAEGSCAGKWYQFRVSGVILGASRLKHQHVGERVLRTAAVRLRHDGEAGGLRSLTGAQSLREAAHWSGKRVRAPHSRLAAVPATAAVSFAVGATVCCGDGGGGDRSRRVPQDAFRRALARCQIGRTSVGALRPLSGLATRCSCVSGTRTSSRERPRCARSWS